MKITSKEARQRIAAAVNAGWKPKSWAAQKIADEEGNTP